MNNFLHTKKEKIMDKLSTKYERKAKRVARKGKRIAVLLAVVVLGALCFLAFYNVSKWYDANQVMFQSPIKIQSPILIKPRVAKKLTVVPVEAKKKEVVVRSEFEIITNTKYGDILWKIYQLETQRGKTDICRAKGNGYGGFGVMDNDGQIVCYPTFEKAVERASYWLGQLHPEKDLCSALCQYNLGIPNLKNCNYYQNYISL